eukprot:10400420-Lingulodinium_polyedra.AAC.1
MVARYQARESGVAAAQPAIGLDNALLFVQRQVACPSRRFHQDRREGALHKGKQLVDRRVHLEDLLLVRCPG